MTCRESLRLQGGRHRGRTLKAEDVPLVPSSDG